MGMGLTEYDGCLSAYGLESEPESLHVGQRVKLKSDWLEEVPGLVCEEGGARLSDCRVQDCHGTIQVEAHLVHVQGHVIHM
jgi:hypothetical protein